MLDGEVFRDRLHQQRINERELYAVIRGEGGRALAQVQLAVLEVTGRISVFLDQDAHVEHEDLLDYLRDSVRRKPGSGVPALVPPAS